MLCALAAAVAWPGFLLCACRDAHVPVDRHWGLVGAAAAAGGRRLRAGTGRASRT